MQNADKDFMMQAMRKEEQSIGRALLVGCILGLVGLIGFAASMPHFGLRLLFIGLLLAVATFVSGSFIGTLFGMPRRNNAEDSTNAYTLNNSLVEIADWLTKIIVGLGLVNLKQLPAELMSIGEFVSHSIGGKGLGVNVFVNSIVVYFGVLGIYIGYNYMRLVLSQKYKKADDAMQSIINKLNSTNIELVSVKEVAVQKELETKELKNIVQEKEEQTKTLVNVINEPTFTVDHLQSIAESSGIFKSAVNPGLNVKVITDKMIAKATEKTRLGLAIHSNDPQKGQWGGKPANNYRQLTAKVDPKLIPGLFRINLKVESTDPDNNPLQDDEIVLFALHDTFGDPPVRLVKVSNGSAELSLISYGSFTVGAITDKGNTELELDLAELPGVSPYFMEH